MADNRQRPGPMQGFGGIIAWAVILCAVFALLGGPLLRGCAAGVEGFGDMMRSMAGAPSNDD